MAKETKNKSFILRIDADTMDALEKWAADEFRSVNGQIEWILSKCLKDSKRLKTEVKDDSATENQTNEINTEE